MQSVRKEHMKRVTAIMYSTTSQGVAKYDSAREMVKILTCLRKDEEHIKTRQRTRSP